MYILKKTYHRGLNNLFGFKIVFIIYYYRLINQMGCIIDLNVLSFLSRRERVAGHKTMLGNVLLSCHVADDRLQVLIDNSGLLCLLQ